MAKKKAASKKRNVNKSAAIKTYLADHPDAGPAEVSRELKKQRISVTPAYVSSVKTQQKSSGKTKVKRGRKSDTKQTSPVEDVRHAGELLFEAVELVMRAGYHEAKSLVEMAGKMVDRIKEKK